MLAEFIVVRATSILDTDRDRILVGLLVVTHGAHVNRQILHRFVRQARVSPVPYFFEDWEGKLGRHWQGDALFLVTAQQVKQDSGRHLVIEEARLDEACVGDGGAWVEGDKVAHFNT